MEKFIEDLRKFGEATPYVESIILVGSYARSENKKDSDIDLVIITSEKNYMVESQDFVDRFGSQIKKAQENYGACSSIRVYYKNGMEVEFGLVDPSWIKKPLDRGTRRVLEDGYRVILDKKEYFKDIDIKNVENE